MLYLDMFFICLCPNWWKRTEKLSFMSTLIEISGNFELIHGKKVAQAIMEIKLKLKLILKVMFMWCVCDVSQNKYYKCKWASNWNELARKVFLKKIQGHYVFWKKDCGTLCWPFLLDYHHWKNCDNDWVVIIETQK